MYRQGDVLLVPINPAQLPTTPIARDARHRLVLARGEATRHAHVITAPTAELLADHPTVLDPRFLRLTAEAWLTHEEHAPILLPPGIYRVVLQREYDPTAARYVAD